ncbi:unnamed protein product [Arctogadus glacialis]
MEDATFVAFCHFLVDVFAGITNFSLLLQRNETILPQAVCALENLLVTTEVMAARPKPGGRLSQFMADLRLQRRQQEMVLTLSWQKKFVGLKLLIARMFKDKTYLSLWELMLTREPYCSDKNILHLVHILLVLPVSSTV